MESPVSPSNPRIRLTRDYTSDEEIPKVSKSKGPMGLDTELDIPLGQPSPEIRPEPVKSEGGKNSANIRQHELSEKRILDSQSTNGSSSSEREKLEQRRKLEPNLHRIDEKSSYEPSLSTASRASRATALTSGSGSRLPDFFAAEVLQVVLHNPATSHQLLRFSQSRLCGENMEFLEKVDRYHGLLNDVARYMFEIHRDYISVNAPDQINISEALLVKVNRELKTTLTSTLPKLESVFVDAQKDVEQLVALDIYPRFVRHQMTMSATKALAGDRGKYGGLGDCFVLTDPAKADNPIVYASDGFVKVTGYPRKEIIPRNCRFLQSRHTDPAAVKRLRDSIHTRQESVELLLNQKKSGEPFWNLLYTTPLFDSTGNVVFFLGGQINCSTTIHNASDVLRILAQSTDTDEDAADSVLARPQPTSSKHVNHMSRTSKFFAAFRNKSSSVQPYRQPGMEDTVLTKIEKMNLRRQMDTFHTAYSKFLVINAATFVITFHSSGITTALFPTRPLVSPADPNVGSSGSIEGLDVFRFLSSHCPNGKLGGDFKSRVRSSARAGAAVSLEVTLCTNRRMEFEKFVSHWTPLKDGAGEVGFVVCALGSVGG